MWYEKAVAQNDERAQVNLAVLYAKGNGVEQDYRQAKSWYEKAAAQIALMRSSPLKFCMPMQWCRAGPSAAAKDWYEKAAEQNFANAQFNLVCSITKAGVNQNFQQARRMV